MKSKSYYVYFLQSLKNLSYYIGVTGDVNKRLKEHNNGLSKSTKPNRPWILKREEEFPSIKDAYKRERFLKSKKSRKIIEKIINSD